MKTVQHLGIKFLIFIALVFVNPLLGDPLKQLPDLASAAQPQKQAVVSLDKALLVPVIMVKNEALVIRETLQPYVNAGIQHMLVFDTGSTDDTVALIKKFFIDNNVNYGVVKQEPFIDFATSRNRAMQLAEESFPNAIFMVMPDAEWYLQNVPGLLKFCEEHKDEPGDFFGIRIRRTARIVDYSNNRLFRFHLKTRFEGVVHEYLGGGSLYTTYAATLKEDDGTTWYGKILLLFTAKERKKLQYLVLRYENY